jgi:hypothetical protein
VLLYLTGNFVVLARPEIDTLNGELIVLDYFIQRALDDKYESVLQEYERTRAAVNAPAMAQTLGIEEYRLQAEERIRHWKKWRVKQRDLYLIQHGRRLRWEFSFPLAVAVGVLVAGATRVIYLLYLR